MIGSPKRRNGLLNNELYRGTIVYNRQRFLKDPATGKRVSRANPESEWLRQDVPELRIVDEELWHRVQRLRDSKGGSRPHEKRRPQRLLSGLIYCGCCGAKFNVATRDFMRCSARTNSGTCQESRLIRMTEVEERVLTSLERHLLTPEMVGAAVEAYELEMKQSRGAADGARERLRTELASVEAKLERMLRLVEDGHAHPAVAGPRLNELSAKKKQLAADLVVSPASEPIVMVRDGGAGYRAMVGDLRVQLCDLRETAGEAVSLVRGLIRRITVSPQSQGESQAIEIEAGFSPGQMSTDRYCTGGCGGWI